MAKSIRSFTKYTSQALYAQILLFQQEIDEIEYCSVQLAFVL